MGRFHHYHVYVIELSKDVLYKGRFRKNNPGYVPGKPCVYVGMTGLDPDTRFDKHKAGIKANRYVKQFGLRLLPELYEVYNPMPYDGARDMEVELAIGHFELVVAHRLHCARVRGQRIVKGDFVVGQAEVFAALWWQRPFPWRA